MPFAALIPLVLSNLPAIMSVGGDIFSFIHRQRTTLQQTGEWTDAQEADYQDLLAARNASPAWQSDPKP